VGHGNDFQARQRFPRRRGMEVLEAQSAAFRIRKLETAADSDPCARSRSQAHQGLVPVPAGCRLSFLQSRGVKFEQIQLPPFQPSPEEAARVLPWHELPMRSRTGASGPRLHIWGGTAAPRRTGASVVRRVPQKGTGGPLLAMDGRSGDDSKLALCETPQESRTVLRRRMQAARKCGWQPEAWESQRSQRTSTPREAN
jgi:hypothetical protein